MEEEIRLQFPRRGLDTDVTGRYFFGTLGGPYDDVGAPRFYLAQVRPMKFSMWLALAGMCLLALPGRACADSEVIQFSGAVEVVGNDASNCSPSPCTVVVNFSDEWAIVPDALGGGAFDIVSVPGTYNYTVSSSLGNSSGAGLTGFPDWQLAYPGEISGFFALPGLPDEVDLDFYIGLVASNTFDMNVDAEFYSCFTTTCIQDFVYPTSPFALTGCRINCGFSSVPVTYPVDLLDFSYERVPEPSVAALSTAGITTLLLLRLCGTAIGRLKTATRSLNTGNL